MLRPRNGNTAMMHRRPRWRDAYEQPSPGWLGMIEAEVFRRTHTGTEIDHSCLPGACRAQSLARPIVAQTIIPAFGRKGAQ